jgi:ATP-dependent Clp protease protease subunit
MQTPPRPPVYATFSGQIDQVNAQKLINALIVGSGQYGHIHLLFQSHGGFIGDGVCLYNFFRAYTTELTLYNTGAVSSMAAIAYLGGKHRKVSKYGTFMIHRSTISPLNATVARLQAAAESLKIDDQRTDEILRSHVELSQDQWDKLNYVDLTFSAEEAVKIGMADEIAEFLPPPTAKILFV